MTTTDLFAGYDETKQAEYEQEIEQRYGDVQLKESRQRWGSYSAAQKDQMRAEGTALYQDLVTHIGGDPASPEVQAIIARWHQHLRWFYEPTREILEGLGQTYSTHPDFVAFYQRLHPALPEFLSAAIACYCRNLA